MISILNVWFEIIFCYTIYLIYTLLAFTFVKNLPGELGNFLIQMFKEYLTVNLINLDLAMGPIFTETVQRMKIILVIRETLNPKWTEASDSFNCCLFQPCTYHQHLFATSGSIRHMICVQMLDICIWIISVCVEGIMNFVSWISVRIGN